MSSVKQVAQVFRDIQGSFVFQASNSSVNPLVLVIEGEEDEGRDLGTRGGAALQWSREWGLLLC